MKTKTRKKMSSIILETIFLIILMLNFKIKLYEMLLTNRYQNDIDSNGFQLYSANNNDNLPSSLIQTTTTTTTTSSNLLSNNGIATDNKHHYHHHNKQQYQNCSNGLLTFELSTGFIYKPSSPETLAMMPGTLQLTDCLDFCLHNNSCLAINFEMGLCVLLSSSAKQNLNNLYSSQFPVFTIYAEKKCLLEGDPMANKQRRRCQRAWTFERVAGYEMKTKPKKRLKNLASKEQCMEACLIEREFDCRSANWFRLTNECTLSDQDRHSVSQSEAGDQQINRLSLNNFYGPSNLTLTTNNNNNNFINNNNNNNNQIKLAPFKQNGANPSGSNNLLAPSSSLYQNYYLNLDFLLGKSNNSTSNNNNNSGNVSTTAIPKITTTTTTTSSPDDLFDLNNNNNNKSKRSSAIMNDNNKYRRVRKLFENILKLRNFNQLNGINSRADDKKASFKSTLYEIDDDGAWPASMQYAAAAGNNNNNNNFNDASRLPANAVVDYLENNCIYEPNKLCEFRKIQNRVLKTVDSIYQDINSLEDCKQKCLNAPYRCYSFDYGDTSEKVCRTSHLDQASLLSVKDPYLDVMGAITYELASCFNVSIQCKAKEMVAFVSSSKMFKGKIYVKSRPNSCMNDVRESLKFELIMPYNDQLCDVQMSSNNKQGIFSNDIIIQHHDRIVTTQDVGLSVYCQYDLGNKSITNNVDLAIEKFDPIDQSNSTIGSSQIESKTKPSASLNNEINNNSPITITSLATTVVRSPNVTMRITNMNGQPVSSATVGDRLALLFEIKEKTSPFGIFVREIIATDGKLLTMANNNNNVRGHHYANQNNFSSQQLFNNNNNNNNNNFESIFETNKGNSIEFIDSDGCPTDANIMGPLVKMDPSGQRILAPFDAFKFPTSDMVFFRAVVTSCVSECKPVLCGGAGGGANLERAGGGTTASNFVDTNLINTDPTALLTSTTLSSSSDFSSNDPLILESTTKNNNNLTKEEILLAGSKTTNSPSSTTVSHLTSPYAQQQQQQQSATTILTRWANNTLMDFLNDHYRNKSRLQQSTTPLPRQQQASSLPSGDQLENDKFLTSRTTTITNNNNEIDLLTTIPGFSTSSNSATTITTTDMPAAFTREPEIVDNKTEQQQQLVNITNNHQGKIPPFRQQLGQFDNKNNITSNQPINLDSLSEQQKRNLIKIFESKLKQQIFTNNSLPSSLVNNDNNSNLQFNNNNINNGAGGLSDLADLYTGFLTSILINSEQQKLKQQQAQLLSNEMKDNNYKRHQVENISLKIPIENNVGRLDLDDLELISSIKSSDNNNNNNNNSISLEQKQTIELENFLANFLREQLIKSNKLQNNNINNNSRITEDKILNILRILEQQQQQQNLISKRNVIEDVQSILNNQQQLSTISGRQNRTTNSDIHNKRESMINNKTLNQQQKSNRLKQQAFADSYLGAYHSFGKRRKRDIENENSNSPSLLNSNYVIYFEQQKPQENIDFNFKQAIIEMYHHNRFKRQASSFTYDDDDDKNINSPSYEMDELVVQSIKIVDRLQFHEDELNQQQQQQQLKGKKSSQINKQLKYFKNKQQFSGNQDNNSKSINNLPKSKLLTSINKNYDEDNIDLLNNDYDNNYNTGLFSLFWLPNSAFSCLIILALSFILIQIILVVVYFLDLENRKLTNFKKRNNNNNNNNMMEQVREGKIFSNRQARLLFAKNNNFSDNLSMLSKSTSNGSSCGGRGTIMTDNFNGELLGDKSLVLRRTTIDQHNNKELIFVDHDYQFYPIFKHDLESQSIGFGDQNKNYDFSCQPTSSFS